MSKAPSESRIPTFGSRIPKPGKFCFLPSTSNLKLLSSNRFSVPSKKLIDVKNEECKKSNIESSAPKLNNETQIIIDNNSIENKNLDRTQDIIKNRSFTIEATELKNHNITYEVIENETYITKESNLVTNLDKTHDILHEETFTKNELVKDGNRTYNVEENSATVVLDSNKIEATFIQHHREEFEEPDDEITKDDIGRRVLVGNVQTGILKYVGNVDFNSDVWCGVELDNSVGRHDGCVNGVRYFTCREGCGIIAPVSKVTFIEDCNETVISGPGCIMEVEISKIHESILNEERKDIDNNRENVTNKRLTKVIAGHIEKKSSQERRKSRVISGAFFTKKETPEGTKSEKTHMTSSPVSKIKHRLSDEFHQISPVINTGENQSFDYGTKTVSPATSPAETPSFPKQNSFEMDESLGILTPDQMRDFSQLTSNFKTPSSDDLKSLTMSRLSDKTISNSRTPSSENLGTLPPDGFKQPSSLAEQVTTISIRPDSIDLKTQVEMPNKTLKAPELSSPNLVDHSTMDYSLGLLDEDVLASATFFSSNLETTTNLELPLDPVQLDGKIEDFKSLSRSDQTPSPEDLPLDPIDPKIDLLDPNFSNPTDSDNKTDPSKSVPTKTNSFITSITSITSLDTGYQGDGEMSRPASRGADHSPGAHKPSNAAAVNLHWQRAIARRQDPMTDSDFFTESDADGHDELASKGDRRAQVIDGTLYGANPQAAAAAADIYINNQEEMDSSGIFTDLDMNPRTEDYSDGERNNSHKEDVIIEEEKSPSDISTKSITENSQQLQEVAELESTLIHEDNQSQNLTMIPNEEKIKSPTQSIVSTSSRKSLRTRTPLPKEESPNKKIKMPKRNVPSKVKTMLQNTKVTDESQEVRKSRKTVGRWDAVMNKISKVEDDKAKQRLTQVKSKVATGIGSASKRSDNVKGEDVTKAKVRRVRARVELQDSKQNSRTTSSIHSSVSDLSVGLPPVKKSPSTTSARNAKKRDAIRCTSTVSEYLTPPGTKQPLKTSPRQQIIKELKKSPGQQTSPVTKGASPAGGRRTPARQTPTAQTKTPAKDQSRVNGTVVKERPSSGGGGGGGGGVVQDSGGVKPPPSVPTTTPLTRLLPHLTHSAKSVEALGVVIQYLVFHLEAFKSPALKRELEDVKCKWLKDQLELEETRMGYRSLEDAVAEQKIITAKSIEQERTRCRAEIAKLYNKHCDHIVEINERHQEEQRQIEVRLQEENHELRSQLDDEISNRENEIRIRIETYAEQHKYKIDDLELKNDRLKQEQQIALEILREENDSIRDQLDDKAALIQDLEELKLVNERLQSEMHEKERLYEEKISSAMDDIQLLKEENRKILETFKSDTKDNKLHQSLERQESVSQAALGRCTQLQDEVESLRSVLDLKLAELAELRRAHGGLRQAAEELPGALHRCHTLQARVEDLELQLARKTEIEIQLTKDNKHLSEICNQEAKQKKRLSLHNEELQWRLKQNSEVVNAILQGQSPARKSMHGSNQSLCDDLQFKTPSGSFPSRSFHTSSFNEKHFITHSFERTLSFRERSNSRTSTNSYGDQKSNKSTELFDLEDSPPSSPKIKGVVEKSDSVSWVLDMDESPEVLASRMVRRAGSFRNVTPPKSTPTKSLATKRPRTKASNLSQSASSSAIVNPNMKKDRLRSKSVSLRDSKSPESCDYWEAKKKTQQKGDVRGKNWQSKSLILRNSQSPEHENMCESWFSFSTSTPSKYAESQETIRDSVKLDNNPDLIDDVDINLPKLPSEIRKKEPDSIPSLPSGDLMLIQNFPKHSAGEAMISDSNSEDESNSSSLEERSPSLSDTETSEENTQSEGKKCPKVKYDLFLMTESTTNSETMEDSWSEEIEA